MRSYEVTLVKDRLVLTLIAVRTLSDAVDVVYTALTVGVLAHEVHRWQAQLSLARIARLLVREVNCS